MKRVKRELMMQGAFFLFLFIFFSFFFIGLITCLFNEDINASAEIGVVCYCSFQNVFPMIFGKLKKKS